MRKLILLFGLIAFIVLSSFDQGHKSVDPVQKFTTKHTTVSPSVNAQFEASHPIAIIQNDDGTTSEVRYTDDLKFKTLYRCEYPKKDGCRICCYEDWSRCWQECL